MTVQDDNTGDPNWKLFLPGLGGWFFLMLVALLLFVDPDKLLWDGAICRHFLNGVRFFSDFHIPSVNYMSAFFPDAPAPGYSFVTDFILGGSYMLCSLNGLELICGLALALGLTWSYQFARTRGLGAVSGLFILVLVTLSCSIDWAANSQVFSYLAFLALYYLLFLSPASERCRMLVTTVVMFVWVNMDNTFAIGFIMLFSRMLGRVLESGWGQDRAGEPARDTLPLQAVEDAPLTGSLKGDFATLVLWLAASCLNLGGIQFLGIAGQQLLSNMRLLQVSLFEPLDLRFGVQSGSYLIVYMTLITLWMISRRFPRAWEFVLINVLAGAPLFGLGFIPYFSLVALPAMGPAWSTWRARMLRPSREPHASGSQTTQSSKLWLRRAVIDFFQFERRIEAQENSRASVAWVRLAIAASMGALFVTLPSFHLDDFNADFLPTRAADYVKARLPEATGFVYDNWGSYVYWRLRRPIFIDECTYAYPPSFVKEYRDALQARAGWQYILDKYDVGYVLLPHSALLGAALAESAQWERVFDDKASELYARKPHAQKAGN